MKPNATPEQSLRIEVPLAFCPLFGETQRETNATRGSDNCNPTLEGGGWKPNGTKLAPEEWRNGALIQKVGGTFFKLVWGEQFGFGVRTSPTSPNATGRSHETNDPGCPQGCLFDIIGPLPASPPVACAWLPTPPRARRSRRDGDDGPVAHAHARADLPAAARAAGGDRPVRLPDQPLRHRGRRELHHGRADGRQVPRLPRAALRRQAVTRAARAACCWDGCCYARPPPSPSLRPWPAWQRRSNSYTLSRPTSRLVSAN